MISGGTAVNIWRARPLVTWEYRCLPDRDPGKILATVQARAEAEVLPNTAPAPRKPRSTPNSMPNIPA